MHKIVENYILYESIGSGQYGKVYRAKNTKTNETVAVKSIPIDKFRDVPKLEEFTANEIKTLNRIKNPNVIKFYEMLKTANNMYLVYEFCDGGTLEDILQKKHHLSEAESLLVFQQLVNAFKAIYSENICIETLSLLIFSFITEYTRLLISVSARKSLELLK